MILAWLIESKNERGEPDGHYLDPFEGFTSDAYKARRFETRDQALLYQGVKGIRETEAGPVEHGFYEPEV